MIDAKILNRIRKILSRTEEAGATQAEAETALSLARKLMDEHGLDEEMVASHPGQPEDWTTESAWEGAGFKKAPEVSFIGPILCEFFHVMVFSEGNSQFSSVRIFGERQRVEVACWAYTYLAGIFSDLWLAHRIETKCRKDRQRAFYFGIAMGLVGRLRQERRDEITAKPSEANALVVSNDRIRQAFEEAYPGISRGRKPTFRDGQTASAGYKAGKDINIARPVTNSGPRAIEGRSCE